MVPETGLHHCLYEVAFVHNVDMDCVNVDECIYQCIYVPAGLVVANDHLPASTPRA